MSLLHSEITSRLRAFLSRRTAPAPLRNDTKATQDQIAAYVRIISRSAPADPNALAEFWERFEAALGQSNTTWSWPSEGEVGAAAKSCRPTVTGGARQQGDGIDPVKINLARLKSGEPIGEDWLWGRNALRLQAAGADPEAMRASRLKLAHRLAEAYGEERTRTLLRALKARHDEAIALRDDFAAGRTERRRANIPDKSIDFGGLIA